MRKCKAFYDVISSTRPTKIVSLDDKRRSTGKRVHVSGLVFHAVSENQSVFSYHVKFFR